MESRQRQKNIILKVPPPPVFLKKKVQSSEAIMDANTSPFLSLCSAASPPPPSVSPSLDAVIENCIGHGITGAQIFHVILVSLAWFFDGQQVFITAFADAQPHWHCTSPSCHPSSASPCAFPSDSWAWDSPPYTSTISEFNLTCSSLLSALPASSFFSGCLVGVPALSFLADVSFGRKRTLLISCFIMSLASLSTAASSNIWFYSLLRFISGFGRANLGSCVLLLSAEIVGKKWRGQVGIFGFLFFTLGFVSLPAIAYVNRGSSWRVLYLWTSTPAVLYCLILAAFAHESPRWLILKGREEEAVDTLRCLGAEEVKRSFILKVAEQVGEVDMLSALGMLVKKRWALRRLMLIMAASVGIGPVYYGMPLAVGSLSSDIYMSVALNALAEVPAAVISMVVISTVGRRWGMAGFAAATAVTSVMCGVVAREGWWRGRAVVGIELVAFFGGCTAMNVGHIIAMEMFPTSVRNTAVAMVREAMMGGAMVSPVLVAAAAGRKNEMLSFGVFGVGAALCCVCALLLPETRGKTMCDTMEEEESLIAVASSSSSSA